MKNSIFYLSFFVLISCNNNSKQVNNAEESTAVEQVETSVDTKAIYNRNVANFKAMFDAWSNKTLKQHWT